MTKIRPDEKKDARSIEFHMNELKNRNSYVRQIGTKILGEIGDAKAVEPLIHVLKENKEPLIRRKAAMALCKIGDARTIKPLIFFMKDQCLIIKWRILDALEKIGDPKAIEPLFSYLKGKSLFTRRKVIHVLSKIGSGTTGPIIKALKDEDQYTRRRAVKVLDNIGWKPSNNNELALYLIAKKKWKQLPTIGKDAVKSLIDTLDDKAQSVRKAVVKILGEIGASQAVEPLIKRKTWKLYCESPLIYYKILTTLAKIINSGKVEPFITALKNKDVNFRLKTAEVLDHIGWLPSTNKELALYLAARKRWNKLPEVGTDAVEPLVNLIKDNIPQVRENAVEALGKIGDSSAVESLTYALKDEYLNVRKKAAEALGKTGDPRAIEPLKDALTDTDIGVRSEAVKALGNMGTGVVELLITLLEDNIPDVRKNAATALGNIGDTRAVEPLIQALKDIYDDVPIEAAAALGKIGDKRAVEPLFDKIRDKNPAWEKAVLALSEIGDTRAVDPLISLGWRSKEAENILNNIRGKIPFEDLNFFCEKCYCRAEKHKPEPSLSTYFKQIYIKYYACRICHSNSYLLKGIEKVVLLLDHNFKEISVLDGVTLSVNWFKREEPFDYDEIHIIDADDYDVEKFVMILRNDMDNQRIKRMPEIPLYLSPGLTLSQAKLNMLKDNFKVKNREI